MFTSKEIAVVEESWEYVLEHTDEAGKVFYTYLFQISPQLRHIFPEDMSRQEHKLISLVTFVVKRLSRFSELEEEVKALGARHKGYGVQPEHYSLVKNALLLLLQNGLGRNWSSEHGKAWEKVYNSLATIMQNANNEA